MLISNSFASLVYLFSEDLLPNLQMRITSEDSVLLGLLGLLNVVFSVMLLKWIKWGFWGALLSGLCVCALNLNNGSGITQSVSGLIGILCLFGVLQVRQNSISAWDNLD